MIDRDSNLGSRPGVKDDLPSVPPEPAMSPETGIQVDRADLGSPPDLLGIFASPHGDIRVERDHATGLPVIRAYKPITSEDVAALLSNFP